MNKVTFFSNYLNHHQLPFCKELVKLTNGSFNFVAQKAISEKRIALGYKNISNEYDFIVKTYENDEQLKKAFELANNSEIVLFGSSNGDYLKRRLKDNKLTFKYSERLFKFKKNKLGFFREKRRVYINHGKYKNKNLYMLCASVYAANDFNKYGAYINKTYKWGYFPETINYEIDALKEQKKNSVVHILWVGRLIDWKHPELAISLAKRLKKENKEFILDIIGEGELSQNIQESIKENELKDCVNMLGSMPPSEVRKYMEKANIFIFTSDESEGWGAVLNEAMNSGCACVASHAIGSAGFLIQNGTNGYIYKDGDFDDLYSKVNYLLNDSNKCSQIGIAAYKTISEVWNAKIAAERFLVLAENLSKGLDTPYVDGPCSKALPIKDDEMYNYLVKNENC